MANHLSTASVVLSIEVASVANADDQDEQNPVVDFIQDSEIPRADTVGVLLAL
jgi:hypothetical protein